MDCFAALATTWLALNTTPLSRGAKCPRFENNFRTSRRKGAGNAGCALHPRSRVQRSSGTHTSIQGSGEHPTFPAQWFYGLCRALLGDEFLFASVAGGLKDCSNPVGSTHLRRLDTSNGCQDHTVLPYAAFPASPRGFAGRSRIRTRVHPDIGAGRLRGSRSLTDDKPALRPRHAPDAAASTATRPSSVTMANAPLSGTGWARGVKVIWGWRQGKVLQNRNCLPAEGYVGHGLLRRAA